MMNVRAIVLVLLGCTISAPLWADKPPIDPVLYDQWPAVQYATLSDDGRYASYEIRNQPAGGQTRVLLATNAGWKLELTDVAAGGSIMFTADSRFAVFLMKDGRLAIQTLGGDAVQYVPQATDFKLPPAGTGRWLAYQLKNPAQELVVRDLRSGMQQRYSAVTEYQFNDDGRALLLHTESSASGTPAQALIWIDLDSGKRTTFWRGSKADDVVLDLAHAQLAFTVEDHRSEGVARSVWHYKIGTPAARVLISDHVARVSPDWSIDGLQNFSQDGQRIVMRFRRNEPSSEPKPQADAVSVDVWSYKDPVLQSQQLQTLKNDLHPTKSYIAALRIADRQVVRLEEEKVSISEFGDPSCSKAVNLLEHTTGQEVGLFEEVWHPAAQRSSYYWVSMRDGHQTPLPMLEGQHNRKTARLSNVQLSPTGRYLTYYDRQQKNYFSYEIASGVIRNLTRGLPVLWTPFDDLYTPDSPRLRARGIAAWVKGDTAALIYDRHDLWQIDPTGRKPPINVTNGYGRQHNIVFVLGDTASESNEPQTVSTAEKLVLLAFNQDTKDSGFFQTRLGQPGDPELLTLGRYAYDYPNDIYSYPDARFIVRARKAEIYLVLRMSATESPNYFLTKDFKTFTRLSDVHPERAYNWLTTELYTWQSPEGIRTQGVLYKPENFDAQKKYPAIVHYYERRSHMLNGYRLPVTPGCDINIPHFVSRGYLVFDTDVHHAAENPAEAARSVISAAQYLSAMPWVDVKKLGAGGCSWGGELTGFVVTHSHQFAAAIAGSGAYDSISWYGSVSAGDGSGGGDYLEAGAVLQMPTLWERPDVFIESSAVLRADQVTTPLLMMNNKPDEMVPFAQGVEFFTALRRLGKPVWMLQYDNVGHGPHQNSPESRDYLTRMSQFFDHYLKDAPPPKWMTEGIPARLKGIETGLELDTSGKAP